MADFPSGLRMAQPGDEDRLYSLFVIAHAENGFGDVDPIVVKAAIHRGCRGDSVVIALVDGPERIEAAIGLHPEKRWYSTDAPENWYNTDLLIYVHPLHRRSRHAMKLFQFAKWWEAETHVPVVLGLMPREGFEEKEHMFERQGRRIGALYLIGGDDSWPVRSGTA